MKQRGFGLIEVMVALLVLSVALAGVAALLLTGMRAGGSANMRSIATTHVQTSVEMMRSNLAAYGAGWYAGTNTSGSAPSVITCSGNSGCDAAELASNDFAAWRASITRTLPGGVGFICLDSTPDDGQPGALACDGDANGETVTKLFWRDSRDDSTGANESFHRFATVVYP